jgi:hypothetical protein
MNQPSAFKSRACLCINFKIPTKVQIKNFQAARFNRPHTRLLIDSIVEIKILNALYDFSVFQQHNARGF